jgi:large subunit ribosomal protein L29
MKKKEAKKLNSEQSIREIQKLKKDLFNMRFKKINGQVNNPAQFSLIKRSIARLYTTIKNSK